MEQEQLLSEIGSIHSIIFPYAKTPIKTKLLLHCFESIVQSVKFIFKKEIHRNSYKYRDQFYHSINEIQRQLNFLSLKKPEKEQIIQKLNEIATNYNQYNNHLEEIDSERFLKLKKTIKEID